MKTFILMSMLMVWGLSGCQNNAETSTVATDPSVQNERIDESVANTEYDSIEDFLADSNEDVMAVNSQPVSRSATPSNATNFSATDTNVSVAISYISVTYECEINEDAFKLKLVTYRSDNGEEQLAEVMESNPNFLEEKEIGEQLIYYAPGSEYDWFNFYAMVVDGKLIVMDIEKGYDEHMEAILENLVFQ